MTTLPAHTFSIDVEEWFQVFYGERLVARDDWEHYPSEFAEMVDAMLALLDQLRIKATFFVVGWLARHHPQLVRKLSEAGHEVASHGYFHREAYTQTPAEFEEDVRLSKSVLEQAIGQQVLGYRAPGYSIRCDMPWAIDAVAKCGYVYDSSLLYLGTTQCALSNGLIELPPNSVKWRGAYYPVNGGFFFRALPYWLYRLYLPRLLAGGRSLNFYTHSWEIYQPRNVICMTGLRRFIQYYNTASVVEKVRRLSGELDFVPLRNALQSEH